MTNNFLVPVLIAFAVAVSGCTSAVDNTTTTTTTAAATTTITTGIATTTTQSAITTTTQAVKEFTVTASQWKFDPNTVTVNEGDTVRLQIKSIDVTHGFNLPAFDVNKQLDPGKTVTVEFVAGRKGTFTFACSVSCGSGHGSMTGKLIVA